VNCSPLQVRDSALLVAKASVVRTESHVDIFRFESCNQGYGANSSVDPYAFGSVPIFDIRGPVKNLQIPNCEIGNAAPFILMAGGNYEGRLTVKDPNFERICKRARQRT